MAEESDMSENKQATYTKKELKKYLKNLVKKQDGLTAFSFEFQSGQSSYHTRLKILITSEKIEHQKTQRKTRSSTPDKKIPTTVQKIGFSTEKLSAFVEELMKYKIWDLENCTERALPDTALLTFIIRDHDTLVFEQEVWESCRNDDGRTKAVIRSIAALLPPDWTPP